MLGASHVEGAVRAGLSWAAYIELAGEPVHALLDLPSVPATASAVLLLPPFGWEEMCSYRARRAWARALAEAGHPTVRIDLPSTGDSGGSPGDANRLAAWTAAVRAAAELARAESAGQRLCAAGVGLGGMLACLALAAGAPIDELILWAVPAQGRRLLREWRAQAAVIAAREPEDQRIEHAGLPLSLIGYTLTRETEADLAGVRLDRLALPRPPERVLVLARPGLRGDRAVGERFAAAGSAVTYLDATDHERLMAHPQEASAPHETIAATVAWLRSGAGGGGERPSPTRSAELGRDGDSADVGIQVAAAPRRHDTVLRWRKEVTLPTPYGSVRESPLSLPLAGESGFAILSTPAAADREVPGVCAVLLGAGALRHVGPNRMWVEAARRWAARGVATVRLDLPAVGEAEGDEREWVSDPALYHERRLEQTIAALGALREAGIGEAFVLGGLCAGAYWALHAALRGEPVLGVLAVNLYCFQWEGELVAEVDTLRALRSLRGRGWRRLRRRDVTEGEMLERLRSVGLIRLGRALRRPAELRQRAAIEAGLDRLAERGIELLLLLCRDEPLEGMLSRAGLLERPHERWPQLTVERLPSRDHMMRAPWVQREAHAALDRGLERALARNHAPPPRTGA